MEVAQQIKEAHCYTCGDVVKVPLLYLAPGCHPPVERTALSTHWTLSPPFTDGRWSTPCPCQTRPTPKTMQHARPAGLLQPASFTPVCRHT